ncbi:MAG: alpha-amylase family glycosyl hydrolase [Cytophaga sp.]|uniref:alpha-amylase family glycosyl hydrolase n=1 Tax=Cytophaga sp. TaxID=29535 RepID=UPI003F7F0778
MEEKYLWWQKEIIYQIYPRSFQDSNNDGVGDLQGIMNRLDYLQELGIKIIWISPIYPSPMADFGYDISDYEDIAPVFGNMNDFDALIKEIHKREMKLILDLVPNHTSDRHPWFIESRSSRDNPKRNWYIWKDAREGGSVPNNWMAAFGGSAWEWDAQTEQYYYHAFLKEQPDLNWRNPEVQEAMLNMMRFWLNKGVDGFRIDVMWHMIKDEQFRDNPVNPDYQNHMPTCDMVFQVYSTDQPEVHAIVNKMRQLMDTYSERMMIGEIYLPINKLISYYGTSDSKGAHLPFNFQLLMLQWDVRKIALAITEYEGSLPAEGWPNWVLGNHDQVRIASRIGKDQARIAAMLLLTLRGTPTIYYGEELGMRDVPIPFEEVLDPQGLNMPDKNLSRDPARTPMQWDNSVNSGFTTAKPWLRLHRNYRSHNVESERMDKTSMLSLYKELIALRQSEASLLYGHYIPVYTDQQMIAYIRHAEGNDRFLVILNFTHKPCYFKSPHEIYNGTIVLSSSPDLVGQSMHYAIALYGDEGVIIRLEN